VSATPPSRRTALIRTVLGAAAGAAGGAAYAYFVGCHTGTCPLTGNVWVAAAFFGFTGGVVLAPGPARAPRTGDYAR
jgi:membrane associated rhomboid family serine protease